MDPEDFPDRYRLNHTSMNTIFGEQILDKLIRDRSKITSLPKSISSMPPLSAKEQELYNIIHLGDVQAVRRLCKSGVDCDCRHPDMMMNSPLHHAVLSKHLDICKCLIEEFGANPYLINAVSLLFFSYFVGWSNQH